MGSRGRVTFAHASNFLEILESHGRFRGENTLINFFQDGYPITGPGVNNFAKMAIQQAASVISTTLRGPNKAFQKKEC